MKLDKRARILVALFTMLLLIGAIYLTLASRPGRVSVITPSSDLVPGGVKPRVLTTQSSVSSMPNNPDIHSPSVSEQMSQGNKNDTSSAVLGNSTGGIMGIFDTASPSDPGSNSHLDDISAAGFNAVLNYTAWDGSPAQIIRYLDYAESRDLVIIFSLKDFYDIEKIHHVPLQEVSQFGNSYKEVALNLVKQFKDHPAIHGWYIADERPEVPSDHGKWLPVIAERYRDIRRIDPNHPILAILQCYEGTYLDEITNIRAVANTVSDLGFDTYPVPYLPTSLVGRCAHTLTQAVLSPEKRWFVVQAFSWSRYPDIPRQSGYDPDAARQPTAAEMHSMVEMARKSGVPNILFYSYFDIKSGPQSGQNWDALTKVVQNL